MSEFGVGTSFIVTLPLVKGQKLSEIVATPSEISTFDSLSMIDDNEEILFEPNELSEKEILLVDDDSRNIFTLTSTLESLQAEVYSAFNGKEAIEVLEDGQHIDLILMDVMMPVMDGLVAIADIKANDKFKDIPIIAITAKTMPEDKQKCLDAGADDYLAKPLEHNALISMIKAWIR